MQKAKSVKMPVFHTKTIESILDPVAQQVREIKKVYLGKNIFFFFLWDRVTNRRRLVCRLFYNRKGKGGNL